MAKEIYTRDEMQKILNACERGHRDHVAFDLQLEGLLEIPRRVLTGEPSDGG